MAALASSPMVRPVTVICVASRVPPRIKRWAMRDAASAVQIDRGIASPRLQSASSSVRELMTSKSSMVNGTPTSRAMARRCRHHWWSLQRRRPL